MEKKVVLKKKRIRCCIMSCQNDNCTHTDLSFFTVPANPERRSLWLEKIQVPSVLDIDLPRMFVCSKHFEEKYINHTNERKRLRKVAVPTLHLPESVVTSAPGEDTPNKSDVDEPKVYKPDFATTSIHTHVTAVKRPLEQDPEQSQENNQENVVKIKEEPHCLTVFIAENHEEEEEQQQTEAMDTDQIKTENAPELENQPSIIEKYKKQVYTMAFKMLALELYFRTPVSYRVLRNSFKLPQISTIYRLCIPKSTELSQTVFEALKIKADSMTTAQKQCVVCVGTMSLAPNIYYDAKTDKITGFHEVDGVQILEPARTALVVMVRGLFHEWKQAVAFAFLSNFQNYSHVKLFIDLIIKRLFRLDLNVRAYMTDVETDLVTGGNERKFCAESPYIHINNKKIYYLYDPLYLMNNIRDYWVTHNFMFYRNLVANFQILLECYQQDQKTQSLTFAPKLSLSHVRPIKDTLDTLDELGATKAVFSRATATTVSAYIDMKALLPAARDTVQWIIIMNKLMETLNFSSSHPPEDKSLVFTGEASQVGFLVGMLSLFFNLRAVNRKSELIKPAFKENVRVTINAILLLYADLKTENCWFPIVGLTRDCLADFFDKIRQKYGARTTAKDLLTYINKFPIFNIFLYSCKNRCPNDLDTFMMHARQMTDMEMYEEEAAEPLVDVCSDACAEFSVIELPTEYRLDHFALYLLHKGYQQHRDCDDMERYACSYEMIKSDTLYIGLTPSDEYVRNLVPREFVEFVEILEIKFKDYFRENRLTRSISELLSFVRNVTFEMPCECFPVDYIKQLYLRCRLHLVLKYNNNLFRRTTNKTEFVVNDL